MKPLALLLALLISFVCVSVQAAPVVRIRQQKCTDGQCRYAYQTGTVIGRDEKSRQLVIVTCCHQYWHGSPVVVEIEPGSYEDGRLVAYNDDDDVGIILVNHPAKTKFIPLSDCEPAVGQTLRMSGFSNGKAFESVDGKVSNFLDTPKGGRKMLVNDVEFAMGQSGGSAINSDYELVGTLTGNTQNVEHTRKQGYFCSCTRIRYLIQRALGKVPAQPVSSPKKTQPTAQSEALPPPADSSLAPDPEAPAPEPGPPGIAGKAKQVFVSDLPGYKQLLKSELGPLKDEVIAAIEKKKGPLSKAELDAILKPHVKQAASDAGVLATKNIKAEIAHEILPKLGLPAAVEFGGPALLKLLGVVGLGVTGPVGIGLGIGGWMLSRHMKGINAGLLAIHNRIHHTTAQSPPTNQGQPSSPPAAPTQSGADQSDMSDLSSFQSAPILPPATKYVQVQVADPLGEALSQMLDKEASMNNDFAPIAARIKHNAGLIIRSSKVMKPTTPFPQLS